MQPEVFATDANTGLSQEWHRGDLGYSGSVHPAQTPAVVPILPKCTQRMWPLARIDHKSVLKFICGEGKADGMDQLIPVLPSAAGGGCKDMVVLPLSSLQAEMSLQKQDSGSIPQVGRWPHIPWTNQTGIYFPTGHCSFCTG